jgi:perosamine synthetase
MCLFLTLKHFHPEITTIYLPDNVYIACYNMALTVYKPEQIKILEIDEESWNMRTDEEYLKTFDKNSAILVVHNIGNIINVHKIKSVRPDIILLEDNCEGIFGKYQKDSESIFTGTSKDILCSAVSFYGNKIITTGEGGAFFTTHKEVYNYMNKVYSQGMSSERYIHDVMAYNFRMTNVEAALLYDQLCDLHNILFKKISVFKIYEVLLRRLIDSGKVKLQTKDETTESSHWLFALQLVNKNYKDFEKKMYNMNIETRPFFYPVNKHKHLECIIYKENDVSNKLNREIMMLPSYPELSYGEQVHIISELEKLLI